MLSMLTYLEPAFTQYSNLVGIALLHHMVFFPQPSEEKDLNSASRVSRASACAIAWCWPIGRNGIWQRCCNVMEWMQRYQGSGNINQQILQKKKHQSKVHMQVHQWSTCVLTVCVLVIVVGNCVAISDAESSKPTTNPIEWNFVQASRPDQDPLV